MFTTRQRRAWLIGALLVPVLLATTGVLWHGDRIMRDRAAGVPGVAAVTLREAPPGLFLFFVRTDEIVLAGTTANAAETRELVDAVRSRAGSYRVSPVLTEGASARLPIPVPAAVALIGAVVDSGVHDFSGVVRNGALTAIATVVDRPHVTSLQDALDAVAGDLRVDRKIVVGPSTPPVR